MVKCFNKLITGVLAVSCLSVAALNVRLMMSTSHSQELHIPSFNITSKIAQKNVQLVESFETKLADIKFGQEKKLTKKVASKKVATAKTAQKVEQPAVDLAVKLINFEEPVKLTVTKIEYSLPTNLVALVPAFNFEEKVMVAQVAEKIKTVKEDSISTSLAAATNTEEEPVFFEYSSHESDATAVTQEVKIVKKSEVAVQSLGKADYEKMADEFISFDYSASVAQTAVEKQASEKALTFNHQALVANPITSSPEEGANITAVKAQKVQESVATQEMTTQKEVAQIKSNSLISKKNSAQNVMMSIQTKATNFKRTKTVKNFEVRFQDDLNEIYEDYGSGEVHLTTRTSTIMNRSMVLLKRGYAPTNTDLIVENNSKVTLPLIEEVVFNKLLDENSSDAASGALLVEFDDETEVALLDSPYSQTVLLDQDLKTTNDENFRYKLFTGVKAGNVYLTYKKFDGSEISKIVHIHEREVTFDANIYEDVKHSQVTLFEEGLLAKELSPLIVTGEQVRVFATDIVAKKLNQNTYKLNRKKALLGDRQYLEVNHLDEPVFVGYRDSNKIVVPSEHFINFVLSKFEDRKLGNRCIIQININAPLANFHIGTESVGSSLVTSSQVLDQDGKFYDSIGPKSNKIIILGENYGSLEQNQDGKVNIKIDYLDGSTRFISSYCSPNTYLVEQL